MLALSLCLVWLGTELDAPLWFFVLAWCEILEAVIPIIVKFVLKIMK